MLAELAGGYTFAVTEVVLGGCFVDTTETETLAATLAVRVTGNTVKGDR